MKNFEAFRSIIEDATGKDNDLGHLAARHYHHASHRSGYRDDTTGDPAKHDHAARAVETRIRKHHGSAAVKAVKQNSDHALEHDTDGSASSKRKHQEFVKKHLGGAGSDSHKKYKKTVDKSNGFTGGGLHHD